MDGWSIAGVVGTIGSTLVAALALVLAVRAGRRADHASAQALEAQREGAEALRRQADVAERLLALEVERSTPRPIRFRVDGRGKERYLVNAGDFAALGTRVEIVPGPQTVVSVLGGLPRDLYPGEAIELAVWQGSAPSSAKLAVTWTSEDGTSGAQDVLVD